MENEAKKFADEFMAREAKLIKKADELKLKIDNTRFRRFNPFYWKLCYDHAKVCNSFTFASESKTRLFFLIFDNKIRKGKYTNLNHIKKVQDTPAK